MQSLSDSECRVWYSHWQWLFPHVWIIGGFIPCMQCSLSLSLSLSLSWYQLVCTNSTLSGPTEVSVAQWAVTVDEHSMRSCVWVHFPDGFPHYAWPAQLASSEFLGSKGVVCLTVTCHQHFWQNDKDLLHYMKLTWGCSRYQISN